MGGNKFVVVDRRTVVKEVVDGYLVLVIGSDVSVIKVGRPFYEWPVKLKVSRGLEGIRLDDGFTKPLTIY